MEEKRSKMAKIKDGIQEEREKGKPLSVRAVSKPSDEYYTQRETVEEVEEMLRDLIEGRPIYCPFDTEKSQFVQVLKAKGYDVRHSSDDYKNHAADFERLREEGGVVLSNPPFSIFREITDNLKDWGVEFFLFYNLLGATSCYKRGIFGTYIGSIDYDRPGGEVKKAVPTMLASTQDIRGRQLKKQKKERATIDGLPVYNLVKEWRQEGKPTPAILPSTWILTEESKHYKFSFEDYRGRFNSIRVEEEA